MSYQLLTVTNVAKLDGFLTGYSKTNVVKLDGF